VSRDFTAFATGKTSPVIEWLKALARKEHADCGGPGVGVIGMCFTGGFALAMAVDDSVLAPVLSQPSLPLPTTKKAKRDLGLSDSDLNKVKARFADDPGLCVLGMRFTGDKVVPAERFAHLREALGDRFVGVEIDSSKGNPHGIPTNAHSVVTEHLVDEPGHPTHDALHKVLDLFRSRLLT
jgi:dienelactone hydrolase